jgi:flagellar assembly protein FliH
MLSRILAPGEDVAVLRFDAYSEPPLPEPELPPAARSSEVEELRARIARTAQEAADGAREAYANGVRDGNAAAAADTTARIQAIQTQLESALADIAELRPRILKQAEKDLVRLSLDIARRVLHREVRIDEQALDALVRVALEKLASQEIVRVRVHSDVERPIRAALDRFAGVRQIEVSPDPTLKFAGMAFETISGRLDAGIDSQLQEIELGLLDCLEMQP